MRLDNAVDLRMNGQSAKYAKLNGVTVWQPPNNPITTSQRVFRHFYDDAIGASPADILHVYTTPWVSTTVSGRQRRDIEGSERGLRLQGLSTQTGKRGLVVTSFPMVSDYEMFTSFRWAVTGGVGGSNLMNRLKMLGRVGTDQGLAAGHHSSSLGRVTRWNTTNQFSQLAASAAGTAYPLGTVVAQRVRVQGTNLKLRVWEWGTREPFAWTLDTTVDVTGSSRLGLMSWGTSSQDLDLIVWGIGACAPFTGLVNDFAPQYNQTWDWQNFPYELMFPFKQNVNIWYPDGWAENRDSGTRAHRAADCYENHPSNIKGAWVHATHGGTINNFMGGHPLGSAGPITPGSGGGYSIRLDHPSGDFSTHYLHMGHDIVSDHENAFAPHPTLPRVLQPGDVVAAGQHIGYLGDSGITGSGPHTHFEIRSQAAGLLTDPQGSDFTGVGGHYNPRWDPFPVLKDAEARGAYPV